MKIHIIQHVSYESPGTILEWANNKGAAVSFTNVFENNSYPPVIDFDLLVIMGGPMGANDDEQLSWIKDEKNFIRKTLEAGCRIFGVCLGSQLLAGVLHAKVYANKEKEIGWWPMQKVKDLESATGIDNTLLQDWPGEWTCFHWHGDTYDLPDGAIRLFSTNACINQGYLYKNQVLALQFHMEVTPELVAAMTANGRAELMPANFIQNELSIINTISHHQQNRELLHRLLDNFMNL